MGRRTERREREREREPRTPRAGCLSRSINPRERSREDGEREEQFLFRFGARVPGLERRGVDKDLSAI